MTLKTIRIRSKNRHRADPVILSESRTSSQKSGSNFSRAPLAIVPPRPPQPAPRALPPHTPDPRIRSRCYHLVIMEDGLFSRMIHPDHNCPVWLALVWYVVDFTAARNFGEENAIPPDNRAIGLDSKSSQTPRELRGLGRDRLYEPSCSWLALCICEDFSVAGFTHSADHQLLVQNFWEARVD
jgi:hypothetical protein